MSRRAAPEAHSTADRQGEGTPVSRRAAPEAHGIAAGQGEGTPLSADPSCIFCKIVAGAIGSRKVYEDDDIFAFHDIHPWAPVHFLLIPKMHLTSMAQVGPEHEALLGRMLALAPRLALEQGCRPYPEGGFRILCNTGAEGGQEVQHLHLHVMGGPRPWLKG